MTSDDRAVTGDVAGPDEGWNRLHPGTILDDALQRIPNVVIGLLLILTSGGGDALFELIQLAIGALAIAPVVVRYLTGRYRVGEDVLQWRMGMITRVHTDLPRHRIQSVDTRISVVGRLLGLQSVVVSSAGGEAEIRIGLIDAPTADRLRAQLTPERAPESAEAVGATDETGTGTDVLLASLGASDLPRVVAVDVGRVLALAGFALAGGLLVVGIATGVFGFGSLVVGFALALSALALARGIVTEAIGFSSRLRGDRIRVARGILARSTVDAPLARVQGTTIERSLMARRLGTERISVDTADVSGEGSRDPGGSQTLVHPVAPAGTWRTWVPTFLSGAVPERDRVRRVAPVSLRRRWFAVARLAVAAWIVLAGISWMVGRWTDADRVAMWGVLAVGIALPAWLGLVQTLRYRNERWALGDDQVAFRGGAFTTSLVVIPRTRTQGVEIRANWFQRRLAVANVIVDTASPTIGGTGRDLHLTDAVDVAESLLASADSGGGV